MKLLCYDKQYLTKDYMGRKATGSGKILYIPLCYVLAVEAYLEVLKKNSKNIVDKNKT